MSAQYMGSAVIVQHYFRGRRSLAVGLSSAGSGFGSFTYTLLFGYLLDRYDWRSCLILQAGLSLQCLIFGALLRPVPGRNNQKKTTAAGSQSKDATSETAYFPRETCLSKLLKSAQRTSAELRQSFDFRILKGAHAAATVAGNVPNERWVSLALFVHAQQRCGLRPDSGRDLTCTLVVRTFRHWWQDRIRNFRKPVHAGPRAVDGECSIHLRLEHSPVGIRTEFTSSAAVSNTLWNLSG